MKKIVFVKYYENKLIKKVRWLKKKGFKFIVYYKNKSLKLIQANMNLVNEFYIKNFYSIVLSIVWL